MGTLKIWFVVVSLMVLAGCTGDSKHRDLQQFMEQSRQQKGGDIEPLPTAQPYTTFTYSALTVRSPFEEPITLLAEREAKGKSTVKPDENRQREFLESVTFASLSLVGTVTKNSEMWSLIDDGNGVVHAVKKGNYLGKNHGRVVAINAAMLEVLEIVPDGKGGWIERPRSLALREKE